MRILSWPCAAIFAAMAFWAPAISHAQGTPDFGVPPSGSIPILYNDHHVYANPDVLKQDRVLAALVRNGTILIPLRSMFEQMGATVSYDPSTQTVTASKPGASVSVTVGRTEVVINGETRPLDVPPIMYHGQVLVPVRVISEGMGAYVEWVPDRHIVVVRYVVATPMPPPPTMAPPPPTMAPPPPTPTPWSWTGAYVGLNAGGIVNHDTGTMVCTNPGHVVFGSGCVIAGVGKISAAGFLGGVQAGYNWQMGHLVLGPEFDYQGTTLQGSTNFYGLFRGIPAGSVQGQFTASENMTSFQTERLRLGFASGRTLIYATGGWAQANVTLSSDLSIATGPVRFPGTVSLSRSGWTEGLGGEWAVSPRMTMKIEGLLYTLQPYRTAFTEVPNLGYTIGKDYYFHGNLVRLGFNWRF